MNKTVTITLNGVLFNIEENAYQKLYTYLESIRAHFATQEGHEEVIADIETSMAEHFSNKLTNLKKVITDEEVQDLMKEMGTIEDFKKFDAEDSEKITTETPITSKIHRKLYRNPDDKIIGGVASGLAAYFSIDATIMRLLFALSVFLGGAGIFVYLVLWVVMPEAKTTAQKMEMHGKPVNLSTLKEKSTSEVQLKTQNTQSSSLTNLLSLPLDILKKLFYILGIILRKTFAILGKALGIFLIFMPNIFIFLLTVIIISSMFIIDVSYMDVPVKELMGDTYLYAFFIAIYFIILVPILALVFTGASLLKGKSFFSVKIIGLLVGVWILALTIGTLISFQQAKTLRAKVDQSQLAYVEKINTFDLKNFSKLEIQSNNNVIIKKGDTFSVTAKGGATALNDLDIALNQNGQLIISKKPKLVRDICILCREQPTVEITLPELTELNFKNNTNNSRSSITWDGKDENAMVTITGFSDKDLNINLADAKANLQTVNQKIVTKLEGYSRLTLKNSASELEAYLSDNSRLNALEFVVEKAAINLMDVSQATINAKQEITTIIKGASRLKYTNDPIIHEQISERGKILKVDKNGNELYENESSFEQDMTDFDRDQNVEIHENTPSSELVIPDLDSTQSQQTIEING